MSAGAASLEVSPALDWLGGMVGNHAHLWIKLGDFESKLLPDLDAVAIARPVYVSGLARTGSTTLLRLLAAQPGAAAHRYQDFPFLFTPYWWNMLLKLTPGRNRQLRERAHGDRILINAESPEAMEEMLWMAFFPHLHTGRPETLDSAAHHPAFETFYRQHIRKLLLARKGNRYVCKNNYNAARLPYLQTLFPDARFIIPVRDPAAHVVSLMRQHERFRAAGEKNPRIVRQMSISGHFEFGLNRIPVHTGDKSRIREIWEAWQRGDEVRGWALYWDAIYRFLYETLEAHPALKASALVVRFEDLCSTPQESLRALFRHCGFTEDAALLERQAAGVSAPDYYHSPLTAADSALIKDITGETARLFRY